MYRTIFLIVLIFIGTYFTFLKTRTDAYTYAYLGYLFYFLPLILGSGFAFNGRYATLPVMYVFATLFLFLLVIGDRLFPRIRFDSVANANVGRLHNSILIIMSLSIFFVILSNGVQLGGEKGNIEAGFAVSLFRYFGPLALVSNYVYRNQRCTVLVGLCLLIYTLLFQIRSTLAFALASVVLVEARRRNVSPLERIKIGLIGIVGALSFILFDVTKGHILRGNIGYLLDTDKYLGQVIFNNNSHNIFWILQTTIKNRFKIQDSGQYLARNIIQLLPFSSTLLGISGQKFGNIIRQAFLPNRTAGIGNNIWAEAYAVGDWIGVAVVLIAFVCLLSFLSVNLASSAIPLRVFAYVVLPYVSVFVHRLSLAGLITTLSNFAWIATAVWGLAWVLNKVIHGEVKSRGTDSG